VEGGVGLKSWSEGRLRGRQESEVSGAVKSGGWGVANGGMNGERRLSGRREQRVGE
jgi:hypothetical protein